MLFNFVRKQQKNWESDTKNFKSNISRALTSVLLKEKRGTKTIQKNTQTATPEHKIE